MRSMLGVGSGEGLCGPMRCRARAGTPRSQTRTRGAPQAGRDGALGFAAANVRPPWNPMSVGDRLVRTFSLGSLLKRERRRVGTVGACPPPLRGRSAVCRPKRRISLWRAKDRLACRFRLDGSMEASRLHAAVKSAPVCGDHSAHRRDMRAFQSQFFARNPRLVDLGALSTP